MYWIKQYIDYKRITVFAFEQKIGVRSTIDKAIRTKSNLRSDILSKIVEAFPDVNAYWLITGKGEMLQKNAEYNTEILQQAYVLNERKIEYEAKSEVYELQKQVIDTQAKLIEQLQQKIDEMQSKDAS